jgi:hypothetical protein
MTDITCPIWQTPAKALPTTHDGQEVDSARAGGRYFISGTAQATLKNRDELLRARLTTWLVDQRRLGVECPVVTSNVLNDIEHNRPLSIQERADRLLRFLGNQQKYIGESIHIEITNAAEKLYGHGHTELGGQILAHAESVKSQEGVYLLEQLEKKGFLEVRSRSKDGAEYVITVDGYTHLSDLDRAAVDSMQAFVAMWFDPSMDEVYQNGIQPAIENAGYEAVRIDRKNHNNKIDDEIIAEIRRSRFLVADFTQGTPGARGGVYYEAGFAHGLNIPVIFTCRSDAIDKVHFDTRQYNHITWANSAELKERLAKRISATLGDGPLRKAV